MQIICRLDRAFQPEFFPDDRVHDLIPIAKASRAQRARLVQLTKDPPRQPVGDYHSPITVKPVLNGLGGFSLPYSSAGMVPDRLLNTEKCAGLNRVFSSAHPGFHTVFHPHNPLFGAGLCQA